MVMVNAAAVPDIVELNGRSVEAPISEDIDFCTRRAVSDLHSVKPLVYWADLFISATIGWSAFAVAVTTDNLPSACLAIVVAGFALYRGLCFTHELTHLRRKAVPGFETTWNILFGVPLLLPSFTYVGVHQNHHSLSTYGTKDDPEYLPFASSRRLIVVFAVQASLVFPLALLIRFLLLAPLGLLWPPFHRWLETYASSFAMNPAYRRDVSSAMASKMRRWELATIAIWCSAVAAVFQGWLAIRAVPVFYAVLVFVSFWNTLRVLGAHDYESDGAPRDRAGQLKDSIDTPGGPWTELWAPVGLRYHALHHYFPGIPYHNLGEAYRRIVRSVPARLGYQESTSRSLKQSLRQLYRRARARTLAS
jgi:fatty acid desaturase